jgi:hypothetical protein
MKKKKSHEKAFFHPFSSPSFTVLFFFHHPEKSHFQGIAYHCLTHNPGPRPSFPISFIISSGLFIFFTLKMEIAGSSKTFVRIYQITRCHIPEDCNLDVAM